MLYRELTRCRSCYSDQLELLLDLGNLCISDFVLPGTETEKVPLTLVWCRECGLVQLGHSVNRDRLYRHFYYRSGTNETMVGALRDIVQDGCRRVELKADDFVLDIGANDGTLLSFYPRHLFCHGYEPARNLVNEAVRNAHARIFPAYFPPPWPIVDRYKVITSVACFYDLDDPNEFVEAIRKCLDDDGVWIVQLMGLESMLASNAFDNICHEHLLYLSVNDFTNLLARHGLAIEDVSYNEVNGGSVRYVVRHGITSKGNWPEERRVILRRQLNDFASTIERMRDKTIRLLSELHQTGKKVYGMGASTKFNTLAQYYGLGPELITAIGERSPEKIGKVTVGTHIPIISEEEVLAAKPDSIWLGPWHFFQAFRERYTSYKGRWIVPLPEVKVIGGKECPFTQDEIFASDWGKSGYVTP